MKQGCNCPQLKLNYSPTLYEDGGSLLDLEGHLFKTYGHNSYSIYGMN